MPTGPVTFQKAWIEMIHRYLAMLVGVLILTLAVFSWRTDRSLWGWPSLSLLWVCVQGAFGALTVTMKLFPFFVTLHLLGGMMLLVFLTIQLVKQRHTFEKTSSIYKFIIGLSNRLVILGPLTMQLWTIPLSNTFGFGGHNTSVIVKKFKG
jgi:heme A synthase